MYIFLFHYEIYYVSILPKIERKCVKYFMTWEEYLSTTYFLQNDV